MGLYFFLGIVTYLLILVTMMVWLLKYHNNNGQGSPKPSANNPDYHNQNETDELPTKPNHISRDLMQAGVQSVSEKSEVLPGYSSQPKNINLL